MLSDVSHIIVIITLVCKYFDVHGTLLYI